MTAIYGGRWRCLRSTDAAFSPVGGGGRPAGLDDDGPDRACQGGKKKLGTLVVAIQEGDTRTLDPEGANELTVPIFLRAVYNQLLTFPGSDFSKVTSDVATKWDVSADGLTYTFEINPDIKFSDGTPLTADDVVFSLMRQKNLKGPASWFEDGVASVAKSGANEVTIKLTSLNVDWLSF